MRNFKYILLFAPAFLIAQNNLFFNRVLNFSLVRGQTVTVPEGKAWNVIQGHVNVQIADPPYGNPLSEAYSYPTAYSASETYIKVWLGEGQILSNQNGNPEPYNIIEYDVIPISSSTTGSTSSTSGFTSTTDFVGSGQYTTTKDYTEADSFTDIDGNEYGAVNIDGAIWSTSNLRVTKFSDGTPIREATSWSDFNGVSEPMYYDVYGDGSAVVYNWYAISGDHDNEIGTLRKNLAPEGYRVTSIYDWKRLQDKYGGKDNAATFLLSRNYKIYPGLDKAGLNIVSPQKKVTVPSGSVEGDIFGTTTYSRGSSYGFYFFGFQFYNSNNSSAGYSADSQEVYTTFNGSGAALEVRVVKDDY